MRELCAESILFDRERRSAVCWRCVPKNVQRFDESAFFNKPCNDTFKGVCFYFREMFSDKTVYVIQKSKKSIVNINKT